MYERRFTTFFLTAVVFAIASPAAAAPGEATAYPLQLTDDAGRTVTFARAPARVVALLPSSAEMICSLGACDTLVGTGDFANWPPQLRRLPKVGGLYDADLERVVAVKPDLVLLSPLDRLAPALAPLGIAAFVLRTETYDDVFRSLYTLGRVLGRPEAAATVSARLRRAIDRLTACAAAQPRRPTVYYEIEATPYAAGPESFIGTLIEKAHGRNILPAELGRFARPSPELILARDPEVIVLGNAPFGVTAAALAERPGWRRIRAVASGRVCELSNDDVDRVHIPGPRLAQGLRVLLRCLHPEASCLGPDEAACEDGPC